jgi:hypothetical protein
MMRAGTAACRSLMSNDVRTRDHFTRNRIMSNHVRKQSDEDIPNKPDANGVCADEEAGSDLHDDEDSTLNPVSGVEGDAGSAMPDQNRISQNDADGDEDSASDQPPATSDGEPDAKKNEQQRQNGKNEGGRRKKSR